MTEEEKIQEVLFRFVTAGLILKDVEKTIDCMCERLVGIGLGEQGFVTNLQDVRKILIQDTKMKEAAEYSLHYGRIEVLLHEERFASVCAEITVISQSFDPTPRKIESKFFQFLSLIKEAEAWKICGLHASTPALTEESLEAYPLKFAEKTLQALREKFGETALQNEELYARALLTDTVGFYIVDFTNDIIEKSQLSGNLCSMAEVGSSYQQFIDLQVQPRVLETHRAVFSQTFLRENILEAFEHGEFELSCEYRKRAPDGIPIWLMTIARLLSDPESQERRGVIYVKNIDREKRQKLAIHRRATRDEMTNLYNKGMMIEQIDNSLNNLQNLSSASFIMVDVDNFKNVNDSYGHPAGDQVLIAVAHLLSTTFRKNDLIGRLGGDEFAIFLPDGGEKKLLMPKLQKLLELISSLSFPEIGPVHITCSIGVVNCESASSFQQLYQKADRALYQSKQNGKNQISFA